LTFLIDPIIIAITYLLGGGGTNGKIHCKKKPIYGKKEKPRRIANPRLAKKNIIT